MSEGLIGAYYAFKNLEGKKFAFAIRAPQANDVPEKNIFGLCFDVLKKRNFILWFGELKVSTPIYKRISEVEKFMKECDFPPSYKDGPIEDSLL